MVGVRVDEIAHLVCLLFADDVVLLADSYRESQRMLNVFSNYCCTNKLSVDVNKNKVLVFRRSPICKKLRTLYFELQPLQYVNSFTYLGIPLRCMGKFNLARNNALNKGMRALENIKEIVFKSKSNYPATKRKLFDSDVAASAYYAASLSRGAVGGFGQIENREN
ncbi:uncharacterized protein LOC106669906 [Cimex lectularius]|uniref:Reverse transcriptase domain-containing protein n=1 Tax=Cimex lectularius TaxID=79782 RepID=A0A8I6RZ93_CIMLE|nr:uncharacterized protein LOC106669906 [Cimex lectularius]